MAAAAAAGQLVLSSIPWGSHASPMWCRPCQPVVIAALRPGGLSCILQHSLHAPLCIKQEMCGLPHFRNKVFSAERFRARLQLYRQRLNRVLRAGEGRAPPPRRQQGKGGR